MKTLFALARQFHLFAGLSLAFGVLFYTISGVTIVYAPWMPRSASQDSTVSFPVPASAAASAAALRTFVAGHAAGRGRTAGLQPESTGGFRQRWSWPAGSVDAVISADTSTLSVTRSEYGALRILQALHVLRGARDGAGFAAWWLLLDIVAVAMIVFAVTGVLLWYRITRDRRLGWAILASSWCYALGLIGYLWLG